MLNLNRQLLAGKTFPLQLQCNYNICVIYNYILMSHCNISFVTTKVIPSNQIKLQKRLNIFNPSYFKYNSLSPFVSSLPYLPLFSSKNFSPPSPTHIFGKVYSALMKVWVYTIYMVIQCLVQKWRYMPTWGKLLKFFEKDFYNYMNNYVTLFSVF